LAEQSKKEIAKKFDKPIVTKILKFKKFYPAETYHQNHSSKNKIAYKLYEVGSGRKRKLKQIWKDKTL